MGNVTHAQVQELVNSLPETKLSHPLQLLQDLAEKDSELVSQEGFSCSSRNSFNDSSLYERRQLIAQQAKLMKVHYEQSEEERADWQAGDFSDL